MKKAYVIIFLFAILFIGAVPPEDFPQAEISNGIIRARLYLPDPETGYYRASRFDWSGIMPDLEYKGHTYFGQWFEKYSPTLHEAVMGPAEDFVPVGYDEAKPGDSFLKIGIGMLSKPDEPAYSIVTPYQIVNGGTWKVKKKRDGVEFVHLLNDKEYGYEYRKTVQLVKGKPQMVLMHTLKNTGSRPIETNVYDHNFYVIDHQVTGPDFVITFPFNLVGDVQTIGDISAIKDNKITFLRDLDKKEHAHYKVLQGFSNNASDYDIRIENTKTGAGVRVTSDHPISKLAFWSASTTVCPEPYTYINIKPGESFSWKITYDYYTTDVNKEANHPVHNF